MNKRKSQTIRLIVMLTLTFGFFIVELVVGYVTGSLALISDSYHMLSDTIALIIGLTCVRISYWNSPNNTYGWVRAEVLGALINSVFLIALCFTIVTDAITRLIEPEPIEEVDLLLYVGIAGLAINVFGLIMFCSDTQGGHHGHSHGGGGGGGGGGGAAEGDHGHSHGGGNGHSHGRHGHHSHGVGNGHTAEELDKDKVDASNGGLSPPKAIEWQPTSTSSPPPSYPAAEVNGGGVNPSIHQLTLTIDGDCGVDNQTAIEVCHEEDEDDDDDGEDAMSYVHKPTSVKSGSQMNMLGVFLHVFGDALGSVVVIISALVIKFVNEPWADRLDPAMSLIMAIIILSTTIPLFIESSKVLMQTVPTHIKISDLQEKLLNKVNGITGLHEFHVWQLTGQRIVASGHIRVDNLTDYAKVAVKVKSFFHDEGIHSTTFQPEFAENHSSDDSTALMKRDCSLECGPDKTCFENTCCSNKLKMKNKKNGNGSKNSSRTGSIDVEPPRSSAPPQEQTNQSFEMVDETNNTIRTTDNGLPSTEGRAAADVEMDVVYSTKI